MPYKDITYDNGFTDTLLYRNDFLTFALLIISLLHIV